MTHDIKLFKELNISNISKVRIGNVKQLVVKGTKTISIKFHLGRMKTIFEILYVPNTIRINEMMNKILSKEINMSVNLSYR